MLFRNTITTRACELFDPNLLIGYSTHDITYKNSILKSMDEQANHVKVMIQWSHDVPTPPINV